VKIRAFLQKEVAQDFKPPIKIKAEDIPKVEVFGQTRQNISYLGHAYHDTPGKGLLEELFFAEDATCVKKQYIITLCKSYILTLWPNCLILYKH
jgi:hypothetical protein